MSEWSKAIEGVFTQADEAQREAMGFTVNLEKVVEDAKEKRVAVLRTSDRGAFRACRRKWNWSSHLRRNLGPKTNAIPLWFGSGFHFAMEDRHGYRKFPSAYEAFVAYTKATQVFNKENVPAEALELCKLAKAMLDYYEKWLLARPQLPTHVVDGVPQVEVNFRIPVPLDKDLMVRLGYDEVVYSGTMDRMVYDELSNMVWVLDYKSAAQFNKSHFLTDSQITAYCWAATCIYPEVVGGMIYAQHKKHDIKLPRILKSGQMSSAQNQGTTAILYKEQMINVYGSVEAAPEAIGKRFIDLKASESDRTDAFIRFDRIPRNAHQQAAEGAKILMEAEEMLNPNLLLYPNPTRDCANWCSFTSACVSLDDGGHFEDELAENFVSRPREYDGWRDCVVWPGDEPESPKSENIDWENL